MASLSSGRCCSVTRASASPSSSPSATTPCAIRSEAMSSERKQDTMTSERRGPVPRARGGGGAPPRPPGGERHGGREEAVASRSAERAETGEHPPVRRAPEADREDDPVPAEGDGLL